MNKRKYYLFAWVTSAALPSLKPSLNIRWLTEISPTFSRSTHAASNYHIGDVPDPRTFAIATKHGVKIEHIVRQLTVEDLDECDYILAMDRNNFQNILRLSKNESHKLKVIMMRDFDWQGKGQEVPDPYWGNEKEFQEVFDILDRATEGLLDQLAMSSKQNQ